MNKARSSAVCSENRGQDIKEEFWFSVTAAFSEEMKIETVIILDTSGRDNVELEIVNLIEKINSGWMPD